MRSALSPSVAVTASRGPRSGGTCDGQCRSHTLESGANFFRHGRDFRIAGHLQHRHRVHEADHQTAIGLLAAIPAVIAYNKLSGDANKMIGRLEGFADEFSTILSRQLEARGAR